YEQLNRTSVSPAVFPIESPSTSQTWRVLFRAYDKRGKTNSLNETGAGTPTPYVDIVLGADTGTFDAAKIQQNTLSDALYIAANVLGIKPLGITEDLIGTFAVSQAKLANAPIIDAVRIVDGAIGTAKIENAAITSALIGTGVILTAHIGDAQITSAKIANLQVDKITGWSGALINFGTGCYFQGHASFQNTVSVYGSFQSHLNAIFFGTTEFGNTVTVNSGVTFYIGGTINSAVGYYVAGNQVLSGRQGAVSNASVTIPTSGSVTADSYTGDAYNVVNELQQKVNAILARLRAHGLIAP
ncbi:MAG TPA: hypothetical protein VNA25_20585, partial [Phycisphaerae bacterium]|nr:hypothetical protein [Phycisphaerae bacterium]